MRMVLTFGFVEPPQKSQPSDRVVDKACSRLGDADLLHLRAFGCDQIAVTASICEGRTVPPSFSFRRRTKLN
jgi:hypothetical protein